MIAFERDTQPNLQELQAHYDAIIIGGGPAGSVSARQLAKSGHKVLLVDRQTFPRTKVCGACLSGRGVQALRSLGLQSVLSDAIPTTQFILAAQDHRAELTVKGGAVISRRSFDTRLIDQARVANATFVQGTRASIEECGDDRRYVRLQSGAETRQVSGSVVVYCGGLGQTELIEDLTPEVVAQDSLIGLTAQLSNVAEYSRGTIWMGVSKSGYVGITRQEDDSLNVSAAVLLNSLREFESTSKCVARMIEQAGFVVPPEIFDAKWLGTKPLTRRLDQPAAERLIVVGDAAGYVEPFTGEGMTWAIELALESQPFIEQAICYWETSIASRWAQVVSRHARRRQRSCRLLKFGLRRPMLVNSSIELLKILPGLAWPILRSIHGPELKTKVASHVS